MELSICSSVLNTSPFFWNCTSKPRDYICRLKANLKALEKAWQDLKNVRDDVKRRVELDEERQMTRLKQVDSWLRKVEDVGTDVADILGVADRQFRKICFSFSRSYNCISRYKLGKRVKEKLRNIDELKNEGNFDAVADKLPHGPVDERPVEETVAMNPIFDKVIKCINEENVKIIGIYGMGGVGKTTLLKKVNNAFLRRNNVFDIVIWVTVSRQTSVGKVQDVICDKLKLTENLWKNKNEEEKAVAILKTLQKKRFVLLLDDIWQRLDLLNIGIPSKNECGHKVVFTTRSEDVCGSMEPEEKFRVECLSNVDALTLFKKKVGMNTLNSHPDIQKLAQILAEECKGLPLALNTVGRAMVGKTDPHDWELAYEKLRRDPSKISGMDDDVFHIIKFSYDMLPGDVMKSCFIFCCIYPEDYDITIDDIVQIWIGGGLLNECEDTYEARVQGREIIRRLKHASLLEDGKSRDHVKMHDVIRDTALWIACDQGQSKNKFYVMENPGVVGASGVNKWMEAERMSLWNFTTGDFTARATFPYLRTLIVRRTTVCNFPSGFFQYMPCLTVLDLSFNFSLVELPSGIEKLVALEYLNVSETRIKELPVHLKKLRRLRHLLLKKTHKMQLIPPQVISSLPLLHMFAISGGSPSCSTHTESNVLSGGRIALLEELEPLEHLNDISITLNDAHSIDKLKSSHKLQSCISYLCLDRCDGLAFLRLSTSSLQRMHHLERFDMNYCQIGDIKIHPEHERLGNRFGTIPQVSLIRNACFRRLRHVSIAYCDKLFHLSWLIYSPSLELLEVDCCPSLEYIIYPQSREFTAVEKDKILFSRLRIIRLTNLPKLKGIYPQALPFPSLEEIHVRSCPDLTYLPFDSSSAKNSLKEIRGVASWWNNLLWDDASVKSVFLPHFIDECRDYFIG